MAVLELQVVRLVPDTWDSSLYRVKAPANCYQVTLISEISYQEQQFDLVSGAQYLVLGTKYQVPGMGFLLHGTTYQYLVQCALQQAAGLYYQVDGTRRTWYQMMLKEW